MQGYAFYFCVDPLGSRLQKKQLPEIKIIILTVLGDPFRLHQPVFPDKVYHILRPLLDNVSSRPETARTNELLHQVLGGGSVSYFANNQALADLFSHACVMKYIVLPTVYILIVKMLRDDN